MTSTWSTPASAGDCASALYSLEDAEPRPMAERHRRLETILGVTDSHVACWRIAEVWSTTGGGAGFAREALQRSEDLARQCVDHDGDFDDFEEEDSWRGRLAQVVSRCLADGAWVARLAEEGLAEDEYVDQLYDDVRALMLLSEADGDAVLFRGTRARLVGPWGDEPLDAMDALLDGIRHLCWSASARAAVLGAALATVEAAIEDEEVEPSDGWCRLIDGVQARLDAWPDASTPPLSELRAPCAALHKRLADLGPTG